MYSETAGLSYENPEIPAGNAHHQEADLQRVVSYPEAPELGAVAASDSPGLHETTAVLDPEPAGIDDLLEGGADDGAAPDPASPAPRAAQAPAQPQVNQPIGSAPRPVEEASEAGATRPLGRILGEGSGAMPAGAGQPGRQKALEFLTDARMRYWRERAIIMVVVGIIFGIIGNWVVGLTLAIIAGIAHAIWRSRSVAAIPPGTKLDKAQRITQRKLARMGRSGYLALHARPIPDSEEMIDHLVVGPTGVYAIDSEKWSKKLPIRTRNGKQLWLGPESKKPRLEHARWEAQKASELLSARLGRDVVVRPALAIYGPHIPWDIAVIREVDVFNGDRLRQYLKKRSKVREARKLSRDEIARLFEAAEAVLPVEGAPQETAPVG
jgi:hypothetical protein